MSALAAREPLSFGLLRRLMGVANNVLRLRLERLGGYIRVAEETFADVAAGHNLIGTALIDAWRDEPYALRHLPAHLVAAQRWEDIETLLANLEFLEAKTVAGLVFDFAGDFAAAVEACQTIVRCTLRKQ